MIDVAYVQRLARYNRWQNQSLYGCADRLSDEERRRERGAFFGSIQRTLCHLLWADRTWLSRFGHGAPPDAPFSESTTFKADWPEVKGERAELDASIIAWADGLDPAWPAGEVSYHSPSLGRSFGGPRWVYVTHFFNHQTHHRGQVHCLLTQAGQKPDDTDLQMMPA
jgi:uncharacterized damage-inducible protein DinB